MPVDQHIWQNDGRYNGALFGLTVCDTVLYIMSKSIQRPESEASPFDRC